MAKKAKAVPVNAQFADQYEGCQVVANIMGLNVETVRKRAKAGKIPGKQNSRGVWTFVHADLVRAGVQPFATDPHAGHAATSVSGQNAAAAAAGPLPLPVKKNFTDVIFVLDRSGSMSGLISKARENLQAQINQLKAAAGPNDQYNVTIINFDTTLAVTMRGENVQAINQDAGSLYMYANGGTRLLDAIGEALAIAKARDDGRQAFLISVLTDGEENSSKVYTVGGLADLIRQAVRSDRYTITYAGPRGSEYVARQIGLANGNITTWDQTHAGITSLGTTTNAALGTYTRSRSAGVMKSLSFYAQPVTADASKFAGQLDNTLDDVSASVQVQRVTSSDPLVISKFCNKKFGSFEKGKYFYQLTESEKVQAYKKVVIQDTTTGTFYSGWQAAKKLLGIPEFQGTVHIKPGNLGDFKVFIQSTSVNRKLVPDTAVVYLP